MEKKTVKSEIVKKLEENRGKYFSGEILASELNVSRAAISQGVKALRKSGYPIFSCTNLGYCLSPTSDLISEEGIRLFLPEKYQGIDLRTFESIDSTNLEAKRIALEGAGHGTAVISNEQTSGRGRLGRSFFSPADTGLYLSILLKPNTADYIHPLLITSAAAVAVCRAISKVAGIEAGIKWVNDIYVDGRKICGILTEGISNFETGTIEYIVIGIGINCRIPDSGFPEDIKEIASALSFSTVGEGLQRNMLAAEIVSKVLELHSSPMPESFMREYRERSIVLGKQVRLLKNYNSDAFEIVKAIDIDELAGLIVEHSDGTIEAIRTGDVSLRLI